MNIKALQAYDRGLRGEKIEISPKDAKTWEGFNAIGAFHTECVRYEQHHEGASKECILSAMQKLAETNTPMHPAIVERVVSILKSKSKTGPKIVPQVAVDRAVKAGIIYGLMKAGKAKFFGDKAKNAESRMMYVNGLFHIGGGKEREKDSFDQMTSFEKSTYDHYKKYFTEWMTAAIKAHAGPDIKLPLPTLAQAENFCMRFQLNDSIFCKVTRRTLLNFKNFLEENSVLPE